MRGEVRDGGVGVAGVAGEVGEVGGERRFGGRVDVCAFGDRVRCRILPGEEVRLLDVSPRGLHVETQLPLAPGRTVRLQVAGEVFGGAAEARTIDGRVTRCAVTALSTMRGPLFRAGIALLDSDEVSV